MAVIPKLPYVPVDTGRKLNVHKTFRRRPGRRTSSERLMYVQFTSCVYWVLKMWRKKSKLNAILIKKFIELNNRN